MPPLIHTEKQGVCVVTINEKALFEDTTVLRRRREIDELMKENGVENLLLDLSPVELAGSAALGMLIRLKGKCANEGCQLSLCGLQPTVSEVLKITQLDQIFDIYVDVDEAIQAIRA